MVFIEEVIENIASNGVVAPSERPTYKSNAWANLFTGVGQLFPGGAKEFRMKLRMHSLYSGYSYKITKNDRTRVSVKCKKEVDTGCSWEMHAYAMYKQGTLFTLKKFNNEHTCGGGMIDVIKPNLSKKLVKDLILNEVKDNPRVTPNSISTSFKRDYGVELKYYYAYHGRVSAMNELFGNEEKSYAELLWFTEALKRSNPGSHIVLQLNSVTNRFERLFVAFEACIVGFNHCRPLLFLDGTHLNAKYKGTLLGATAKNGDQGFFPFAFAIVSSEDDANWLWFIQHLKLSVNPLRIITFVSDRNHGVLKGVEKVFPESPHAYCFWHLKNNLKTWIPRNSKLKNYLVWLLTMCAYTTSHAEFDKYYSLLIKDGGRRVAEFLDSIPCKHWANLFFPGQRYGEMTSALAESFNGWIRFERSLPITALVDKIRIKLMKMISDRREECKSWTTTLCPTIDKQISEEVTMGRAWSLTKSSEYIFEVHTEPRHMVDLSKWYCSCGMWRMKRLPCAHAVCAIQRTKYPIHHFVDVHFTSTYFQASYSSSIHPVPTIDKPDIRPNKHSIQPPFEKRGRGRPKTKRIESAGKNGKKARKCGRCNKYVFHNKKTCTALLS